MSKLTDGQLERLSILFATGKMSNAGKIVRLLGKERESEPYPKNSDNALPRMLDRFLRAGAAENWTSNVNGFGCEAPRMASTQREVENRVREEPAPLRRHPEIVGLR